MTLAQWNALCDANDVPVGSRCDMLVIMGRVWDIRELQGGVLRREDALAANCDYDETAIIMNFVPEERLRAIRARWVVADGMPRLTLTHSAGLLNWGSSLQCATRATKTVFLSPCNQ